MALDSIGAGFGRTGTIFNEEWIAFLPDSEAGAYMKAPINDYFDGRMHDREHLIQNIIDKGFQTVLGYKG